MAGLGIRNCNKYSCVTTEPLGNDRNFKSGAGLTQSKVQMTLDFDIGRVWVEVNETC